MFGFTESLNISVSAAIIVNILTTMLHDLNINWHLSDEEKQVILNKWLMSSIKKSKLIEEEFFKNN
jgi:tRNA (guanosine-2'-O-)-methyltransferase